MTDRKSASTKSASGRGRRPAPDEERKDRVIQTRVPRDLETTLKEAAEQKRMTVSHLIRNVLEDTFTLVDGIVADSSALVEHVTRDARRLAATARGERCAEQSLVPVRDGGEEAEKLMDEVEAWQEVVINRPAHCIDCGVALNRGDKACRGLTASEEIPAVWLCSTCLNQL